jgi:Zn-dependent metalloprotease
MSCLRAGRTFGSSLMAIALVAAPGSAASRTSAPDLPRASSFTLATAPAAPSPTPKTPASAVKAARVKPEKVKAERVKAEQAQAPTAGRSLHLGVRERLIVKDVITDADGSTHVRYDRTLAGLRVIGGDLVSHRDRSGTIKDVSWNRSGPLSVASTTPKISPASARVAGARRALLVQKATASTKAELVVYSGASGSGSATPKLAFDVRAQGVLADQTPSRLHIIVDATSGATLKTWDEIETASGKGVHVGTVSIATVRTPASGALWLLRDASGSYTTDLKGSGTGLGAGTTLSDADNIWGNGAVTNRASAGVDAHYGAAKTLAYFKSVLGRNGVWNTGPAVRSRVHFGSGYQNAYWDGTQMTYGDGAGNTHPLTEIDVAGHEMTHGITGSTARLVGDGEAGGLNEATSDIFGTSVEWYANNVADKPDYLIGEKININGNGTPLRYMDRPSRDGRSKDCWSSTLGSLDVHYSGGPLNHWFYLASEGSGAKTINGVAYNSATCNASSVVPIGRDKAARIWYRTLTTYLTSNDTYGAAREGAIQSAKDLYGATSPECVRVAAAFSAIGVRPGNAVCAATALPPTGVNLLRNPGFESGDTLWAATPGVIGIWSPRQLARSGTRSAWLGGDGVAHHDSISQLLAIPATATTTLSYYAHIATAETAGSEAYDTMTVSAGSTVLQTLSNATAHPSGYQLHTVNLSAYAGKTVSLSFSGSEDATLATSFVLDDLSLTAAPLKKVPGPPTAVTATAGTAEALVSWSAPASDGGSPITGYRVTPSPGGASVTVTGATTAKVTGLTNGIAYTFTVAATNAVGVSPASLASGPVTPAVQVPGAPTSVLAAAGDAQAVVSWAAPVTDGGSAVTGYLLTASPGGETVRTTVATSATVTGLANGTAYTFTVKAENAAGTSPASLASAAVTPTAVPDAPTGVEATAAQEAAVVSWSAPVSDGGSPITGYQVTASPGGAFVTTTGATTVTVGGLTNGTAYTFTVTAESAAGTSPASAPSVSVTPGP